MPVGAPGVGRCARAGRRPGVSEADRGGGWMATTEASAAVAPFEAIPTTRLVANHERELPRWLASMALEHGPIFRVIWNSNHAWHPIYLVGPEANRFVLHT